MPSTPIVHTGGLDGGPRGSGCVARARPRPPPPRLPRTSAALPPPLPLTARSAEILSALGSSQKKRLFFFADEDKAVGSHAVTDLAGVAQSVDSVQTWDRCSTMLLTSADKREAVLLMDTETGTTTSELVRARAHAPRARAPHARARADARRARAMPSLPPLLSLRPAPVPPA